MRESRHNRLHGHKLLVAQRREQLIALINTDPNAKWSVRVMAEKARDLDWFKENQPTYSKSTAAKDYTAIMEDIKDHREELADHYIRVHIEKTDEMIADLEDQRDELEDEMRLATLMIDTLEAQIERSEEFDLETTKELAKALTTRSKLRKEARDVSASILQVMRRQSTLVPIQVPFEQKGADININNNILSLDMYQEQKELLVANQKQLAESVIDGEYEEN